MTDENRDSGGNGSTSALPQFALQRIYVKDLSFEIPNAPAIFEDHAGEQDIKLNINTSHAVVGEDLYEVVLRLDVHAKVGTKSLFLVEMEQAGIFLIKGYGDEELKTIMGTYCPGTLFPYARESISSTVGKGGFPPLVLQPINFDALYAQAQSEQRRGPDDTAA